MNLQVSYKLKKGRQVLVAIVGRGATRFELGTGVRVPPGVRFVRPKSLVGGDYKDRNNCDSELHLWEVRLRAKWDKLRSMTPMATAIDLKMVISNNKLQESGFDATLLGWLNKLESRKNNGELSNDRTGNALSPSTLEQYQLFIDICRAYISKHGDFDFGRYNSGNIQILGKPDIVNKYKAFGATIKRYLNDERQFGRMTVSLLMAKLRWLVSIFSAEYNITIERDLMAVLRYSAPASSNNEEIVALEDDQFDWLVTNEDLIRRGLIRVRQQDIMDYIIVGLLTCARKGDMSSWTAVNLNVLDNGEYRLTYTPEKKRRSSSPPIIDITPLPAPVVRIFKKNLVKDNRLMPVLPTGLSRSIRNILKDQVMENPDGTATRIFDKEITIRTAKGELVKRKTWVAFKAHSLRSSGITHLLSAGMPEIQVKKISGHSPNSHAFAVYAKPLEKNRQDKLRDVNSKYL